MATRAPVLLDDYLETSYEGPDREYLDGEVVERSMPNRLHSRAQSRLIQQLAASAPKLETLPELRVRVGGERVRILDLAVYDKPPSESFPSTPPLIAIEILSPDDRAHDVLDKLDEYRAWGAKHIWLIDPESQKLYVYDAGGLRIVERYEIADPSVVLTPDRIF